MAEPSAAPTVPIELGGKTRHLKYDFRAFKALNVNPFNADAMRNYMAGMTIDGVVEFAIAGLRHEEPGLEPEKVIDWFDMVVFGRFMEAATLAIGGESKNGAASEERPT